MGLLVYTGLPVIRAESGTDGQLKILIMKALSQRFRGRPPQKQPAASRLSHIIRGANNYVQSWRDGLTESERQDRRRPEERKQVLAARMGNALSMEEWETAAKELDQLEGNDEWKMDPYTGDYHPELVREKLQELDDARASSDIRTMMYLVRTALSRDLGDMGNLDLYRHSYVGTKDIIERYVKSAIKTIEAVVERSARALPEAGLESKDLLEGMLCTRQSFGRSALLLSGGATFGMAHIGVLKAMFEAHLLPRIISGASAGSIICAVLCARKDEEIPELLETFPYGDLAVFESEMGDGITDHIRRLLTEGSWADIKHLTRVMRGMLGDMTFQEAYNRTRRICNICVSSASIYDLPRLLNYITAPNVMIWSAVAASCSVPLVFNAAPLLIKDPATGAHVPWNPTPQRWIDGSVDNDLPMTHLAEMFNVNHFIVSQVNPHAVPFLSKDDRLYPGDSATRLHECRTAPDGSEWLYTLSTLAKDEALHRLHFLAEMGIFPNLFTKLRSILSQKYSGDITILPAIAVQDLPRILKNPTSEFMARNCLVGERATWPKLSRIRDRCAIELALDHAVHDLRARVVFSKSQVDLRRLITGSEQLGLGVGGTVGADAGFPPDELVASTRPRFGILPHRSQGEAARGSGEPYPWRRRRRNSGGSIQLMVHHKQVMQGMEAELGIDDESEDEGRLEIMTGRLAAERIGEEGAGSGARHQRRSPRVAKPRLKRAAKSQYHLPFRGPLTSPLPIYIPASPGDGSGTSVPPPIYPDRPDSPGPTGTAQFDFSKPLTPPMHTGNRCAGIGIDEILLGDGAGTQPHRRLSPLAIGTVAAAASSPLSRTKTATTTTKPAVSDPAHSASPSLHPYRSLSDGISPLSDEPDPQSDCSDADVEDYSRTESDSESNQPWRTWSE